VAGGDGHTGFSTGGHTRGSGAAATGAGCGALAHAASSNTAIVQVAMPDNGTARNANGEKSLGWVFLEIGVALVVAVLIVWWTLPRKPRDRKEDDER
jgi:hypothetical protein